METVTKNENTKISVKDEHVEKQLPPSSVPDQKITHWFRDSSTAFTKCLELFLILIVMAISTEPIKRTRLMNKNYFHVQFFATIYGGCSMFLAIVLLGRALGEQFPYRTLAIFSYVSSVLFIAAGTLTLADWNYLTLNYAFHPAVHLTNLILASGIIDLSIAVLFALDGYRSMKKKLPF